MDSLVKQFDEVAARILAPSTETILLVSPEKPDPDSVACQIAFRKSLRQKAGMRGREIRCLLFAPEPLAENSLYELMKPCGDPYTLITTALPDSQIDVCVVFDYGDIRRTHTLPLAEHGTFFIGIDHHPSRGGFPSHGIEIIDKQSPSTTSLLFRFFLHSNFPVNADIATCLLAGLAADTGKFGNSLANIEAFETTGALMRLGARYQEIASAMLRPTTLARLRAQCNAFPFAEIDETAECAFLGFSRKNLAEWNATEKDMLSLRDALKNTPEIKIAVAYYELPNGEWCGTIRTKQGASITAEEIAKHFDGGGHEHAAGFTSRKTPEKIKTIIAELIQKTKTA